MRAIPSRSTMPIMECIYIQSQNDKITFTSNDGEMAIETEVRGGIVKEGHVAIEAKIFSEIIRRLSDDEVTITVADNYMVTIDCGRAHFNIPGKDGEDFTGIPEVARNNYVGISQFSLKEIIRQTIFSISESDNNHMMAGELMEISGNKMQMTSLDGYRVSIRRIELKDNYPDNKVIIPGKTLNDVCKILSGGVEDEVLIFFTQNNIVFEFDETTVVSRLIEGEYFKVSSFTTSDYETKVTVNKKDLMGCIDRSSLLIKESDMKPLIMTVNDSNMQLLLKSAMGTLNEEIDVAKTGKDIMIGFKPAYLADVLRVIDEDEVTIYMQSTMRPAYIKDEADSYFYLILPLNFTV